MWFSYFTLKRFKNRKIYRSVAIQSPTMENFTNSSLNAISPLSGPGFVVFNAVMLLGVLFPVIAVNTVILVALVLESSIVKVVRLVLGSILVSCLIVALSLVMNHIAGIVLSLSPVNSPPDLPCTITIILIGFGGAARLVFMAMFAVIVCVIVRYGKATNKRSVIIAVLVAVVILGIITCFATAPLFLQSINRTTYRDSLACGISRVNIFSTVFFGLYVFVFCLATVSVAIVFLLITICFLKSHSISDKKVKKAMVKFGFFLLLGNGISFIGQLIPVIIASVAIPPKKGSPTAIPEWNYISFTFLNAALIPTPILVLVYFKPIRKQLRQ